MLHPSRPWNEQRNLPRPEIAFQIHGHHEVSKRRDPAGTANDGTFTWRYQALGWQRTVRDIRRRSHPGKCWVMFWSLDSFFKKRGPLEWCCQSTESQLGLPKLLNLCLSNFHLSALSSELRGFFPFLVLKTHVSATWKTLLPMVAPMPPIKTSLSSSEFRHVTSEMNYIYAPLTPCHLLRFRPLFASSVRMSSCLPPRV